MIGGDKLAALARRLRALGVRDEDLDEQFVRSGGAGGQNVNKVATCVLLHHLPSGTRVKCQEARTQAGNRYLARVRLCERLEAALLGRASVAQQEAERIRRQKRRRSRRARARMLEGKRMRAEIKAGRGKVQE